jgi:hypothetical protein
MGDMTLNTPIFVTKLIAEPFVLWVIGSMSKKLSLYHAIF